MFEIICTSKPNIKSVTIPDYDIDRHLNIIIDNYNRGLCNGITITQNTVLDSLRLRIAQGELSHEDVVIIFDDGSTLTVNEYGKYVDLYSAEAKKFILRSNNILVKLIKLNVEKAKVAREKTTNGV